MSSLAMRLTTERELRDLSLSQLAEKAGISKGYLSQIEAGKQENPGLDVLKRLADALDTTIGALIGSEVRAADTTPDLTDPGLREFLDERRRAGRPIDEVNVRLLLQLQCRNPRVASREDWARFYEHLLPMWDSTLKGKGP